MGNGHTSKFGLKYTENTKTHFICQESRFTWSWAQAKRSVSERLSTSQRSQITLSLHHLSKSKFRQHLILPPSSKSALCPVLSLYRQVSCFDMVAEQVHDLGLLDLATSVCPVCQVLMARLSINHTTSSSGEERPHWSSKLQDKTRHQDVRQ